jgi:CubicO group peptidase (beta-lactamase class C family)
VKPLESTLPGAAAVIQHGIDAGQHIGVQLYVSERGRVVVDVGVGEARAGQLLAADTLMLWMSSVKPISAVAILQLVERGLAELDDPVCRHIPEFAAGGKQDVTLKHVLTHTGGFRNADPRWSDKAWDEIVAGICAAELDPGAEPGRTSAYHVSAGWYILGEVVRRCDGRPIGTYARESVLAPIGSRDVWLGMPAAAHAAYGARIAPMHDSGSTPPAPFEFGPFSGSAAGCSICRPGGSAWGPIRELGWLYEALLLGGHRNGGAILQPESVALMTRRHTRGLRDAGFGVVLERGLGLVIDSKHVEGGGNWFGHRCSRDTFGHGGFGSSVGFADPEHQRVVALVYNGMLEHGAHEERMRETVDAIYKDLAG